MNRLFRRIGGFVKRAAPILKTVAKVAAPIIAAAVGVAFVGRAQSEVWRISGRDRGKIEIE